MEIIFYLFLFIFGVILAVFLLTVFFGAPYVPTHKKELIKLFEKLKLSKKRHFSRYWIGRWCRFKNCKQF